MNEIAWAIVIRPQEWCVPRLFSNSYKPKVTSVSAG